MSKLVGQVVDDELLCFRNLKYKHDKRKWTIEDRCCCSNAILIVISSYFVFVYSKKKISWEEDVLLNNGNVLLISRSDIYHRAPEPGNPMRTSWWIESRQYEFMWAGKKVRYERKTAESLGAFMLYVDPESGRISIMDRNNRCARPGYAKFNWNGEAWVMQKTVSRNAIGLRRNLLSYYSAAEGRIPSRVDVEFIDHSHLDLDQRRDEKAVLDESELAIGCY